MQQYLFQNKLWVTIMISAVSPETHAEVELELILDCSTANVTIKTVFNIPDVLYTILYTCNQSNLSEPVSDSRLTFYVE